ncbi:hypothetical protein GN956_G2108 [Arapaima gigas]
MVTRCLPLPYVDLVVSRQPKPYFRFLIVGEVGRRRRASRKLWTAMAWTYITVFAGAALQVICETSVTEVPLLRASDCCGEVLTGNGTCLRSTHCGPGCYLRMLDNDTAVCELCDSRSPQQDNFTSCNYTSPPVNENLTTVATVSPQIGGPGVAASLLLGTLLISLLLILSVASFFYLKRSNRLPGLFYRRKKGCHDINSYIIRAETKVRQKGAAVSDVGVRHYQHCGCDQGPAGSPNDVKQSLRPAAAALLLLAKSQSTPPGLR